MNKKPPRILGILLVLLGAAFLVGGIQLSRMGGNAYFIVIGTGIALSGLLIFVGKILGAYLYAVVLAIIIIWSFLEVGTDYQHLIPRLAIPIVIGIYIFSSKVKSRLS